LKRYHGSVKLFEIAISLVEELSVHDRHN
jgi:hypothetical protein